MQLFQLRPQGKRNDVIVSCPFHSRPASNSRKAVSSGATFRTGLLPQPAFPCDGIHASVLNAAMAAEINAAAAMKTAIEIESPQTGVTIAMT